MAYYSPSPAPPHPAHASPAPLVSRQDLELVASLSSPSTQPALKASAAIQAVDPLSRILLSPSSDLATIKVALAGFASAYPFLFRYATQSGDQGWWARVVSLKTAVLQQWRNGSVGAKVGAVKVIQRIVQTQSTSGTADPRLRGANAEPNLSLCRPNHPFLKIALLEEESNKLLEECVTTLFTSPVPDVVSALVTSLSTLIKTRPQFAKLVVTSLTNWSPAAMVGQHATQIRSVEKVVRLSLTHLLKNSHATAYSAQITTFRTQQAQRMEQAAARARQEREEEASRKRQLLSSEIDQQAKRRRLNPTVDSVRAFSAANPNPSQHVPPVVDLPLAAVVDAVVAILQNTSSNSFSAAIEAVRRQLPPPSTGSSTPLAANDSAQHPETAPSSSFAAAAAPPAPSAPAVNPLALDLGADELDLKPEVPPEPSTSAGAGEEAEEEPVNHAVAFEPISAALPGGADGDLSTPFELTTAARESMILGSLRRICAAGPEGANAAVWVPLVSRLITRGLEVVDEDEEDAGEGEAGEKKPAKGKGKERAEPLREVLFKFITADLQSRTELARLWLNEEWYATKRRNVTENRPYDRWLRRFLEHVSVASKNQDKELLQFMMDLPELPVAEISRLEDMCLNADQMQLGFSTLRELIILRPSVRPAALDVLLGLTTHADKRVRNAAIMTVKKWVPDVKELSDEIVKFAVSLLKRMTAEPVKKEAEGGEAEGASAEGAAEGAAAEVGGEEDMAMDATPPPEEPKPPYAQVKGGEVVDRLDPPTALIGVVQHVELLLALCVKEQSLLFPLFETYPHLPPVAREGVEELIQPLMRALGIKHEGLLQLLGDFPEGSDHLVLKVLDILLGKTKPPANIIASIKEVAAKRDLDPRFYAIIMSECNKTEIVRYLPRVVSLLNGTPQQKAAIRSIFLSIIAPPAHFSSINSLRTRSDSLSPVELMIFLHKHDTEMGIKKTIEAIGICFSMADGFRPEILAAFMQQVVDEPNMPNLFLRTVIQAVTTYKSLQPFVSTTLLSRLIGKKVWTVGPLWEGFIRLAKAIAPNSFAALLQLPKEQLSELVQKQPTMRTPLREYVLKKGGVNNARSAAVLEAIGEDAPAEGGAQPSPVS
ncbi:hypothetical protein JCM6882_002685 [Rhodosporidiobolus microsporus]